MGGMGRGGDAREKPANQAAPAQRARALVRWRVSRSRPSPQDRGGGTWREVSDTGGAPGRIFHFLVKKV